MSCNYAEGLSPYENKGILGAKEKFDSPEEVDSKCKILFNWLKESKHTVVHTGAGISTSAGIPDFRGPNGVWTLEKKGEKPNINTDFGDAKPTKTHMALKCLVDKGIVNYIISQNIDGLHLKSGIPRSSIAELHGNMFTEQCNTCESQFVRERAAPTVGKKSLGIDCRRTATRARSCRGKLCDTILDWEHNLPDTDLEMSEYQSSLADLNICLGTTLQIVPSGNLPLKNKKFGGKLVIVNLQPTKHDKKADLIINTYVDDVFDRLMSMFNFEIPEYCDSFDPTKNQKIYDIKEWNILKEEINHFKKLYSELSKNFKKRKLEEKDDLKKKLKEEFDDSQEFESKELFDKSPEIKSESKTVYDEIAQPIINK